MHLNKTKPSESPAIFLSSPDFISKDAKFLIDTGSDINLIKENLLNKNIKINKKQIFGLIGITNEFVHTLGTVIIKIKNINCLFSVVPADFQIAWDGLLGNEFLKENKANLSYEKQEINLKGLSEPIKFMINKKITLPARSKTLLEIEVANKDIKEGYIRKINAGPDIFIGECLVTNIAGKAKLFAYNCSFKDINLRLPPIELEEFETDKKYIKIIKALNKCNTEDQLQKRILKIMETLNLEGLNDEEKKYVAKIVMKFLSQEIN